MANPVLCLLPLLCLRIPAAYQCQMWFLQVVVFSWSGCPFCKRAKAVLDSTGAKYTALELDQMADGASCCGCCVVGSGLDSTGQAHGC